MLINIEARRPMLGFKMGGVTGTALRPVAVRCVYDIYQAVKIPIIGMGGIQTAADAIEFIMAGASAVAVGTANFYEPQTALQVIAGLRQFMQENRIQDLRELIGSVQTGK